MPSHLVIADVVAFSGKALKPMVQTNGSSFSNNHASSSQETTLHGKADVLRLHRDTPTQASQNHTGTFDIFCRQYSAITWSFLFLFYANILRFMYSHIH